MDYSEKFSYDIPNQFPVESTMYNRTGSGIDDSGLPPNSPLPPPLNLNVGGFDAKSLTDELKISAETANFRTGAFGKNSNMFSQLTTSNKLTPTSFYVDNKDVYENLYNGNGVSRFPNIRNIATDEDRLGRAQTTGEQVFNGLTKAGQNFTKVFVQNTAGAVYGLGSAITNGEWSKLYDNDFSDALDDWNTRSRYSLGNYRTENEKQMSFFEKMGTANFWADDFAQGLSFTLGTIASELAWGAMTGGGGLFAGAFASGANTLSRAGRVGEGLASVFRTASGTARVGEEIGTAAVQTANINRYFGKYKNLMSMNALSKIKDGSQIVRSIYTSAAMEGGMEAKQTFRDSYDSYIQSYINATGKTPDVDSILEFDNQARKAANLVFAANIPIVAMSNFAQFGSLFGINFGISKALGKATGFNRFIGLEAKAGLKELAETAGKDAFKVTRLGKITGVVAPKIGTMLTEGVWEEGTQGILSTSAKEWLKSRYDVSKTEDNLSIMEAMRKGMENQYGSKEGREEMYIGMLIGAFGGNISQAIQTRSVAPLVTGFVRSGNAQLREGNVKAWDQLREEYNTISKKSVDENFTKVFNNALNNIIVKNQQDYNEDRAVEALNKGDIIDANMFKMNSEFAKHFMTFERIGDYVDFSFEDLMLNQVNEMDEAAIAKEHGVSLEEARQAKEDYKDNLKTQIDNYRKADRVAKATLNLMGKVGQQVSPLRMFLTNQLYNAQGLDSMMSSIATKIGDLWNTGDTFFASRLRLIDNLRVGHDVDLQNYQVASRNLEEARDELVRLNNELPSLVDTQLDANGNRVIVNEKIKQLDKIQELTAKVEELEKDVNDKLDRLNNLTSVSNRTKFGGLFEDTDYTKLSHQDIQEGLKAIEDLDTYKQELLKDKRTKQQGIYLHNLLEAYGKGLATMQNLSTLYDELADKNNKNIASFILRLKGGNYVEDFNETEQEKKRLDGLINSIEDKFLRDRAIGDKTEARSIIRALLRAGERLTDKRFDRDKDLVKIYDYETKQYKNEEAYLTEINEPIGDKAWSSYVKEGLLVDDNVNPNLEENASEIVRKVARRLPLSNREQIIYNENRNYFTREARRFRKNPTDGGIETFESVLDSIKQRRRNAQMVSREEYMNQTQSQNPEKDYLEEKIARKLQNLSNFFQSGLTVPSALELVRGFSEGDISRYIDLRNKGVLNQEEQAEYDALQEKLQVISEFQGTVTEESSNLLDDLNQLAQLLNFTTQGAVNRQAKTVEVEDVANAETDFTNSFRNSDGRDLSVAQNYAKSFVTRREYGDQAVIEISNISPASFVRNLDATMTDLNGNQVNIVNLENRDFINQSYLLNFTNGTVVPFTINENGNLVFNDTNEDFTNLKNNSNYIFEAISSFTKAQPLLFVQDGEVLYVDSDFTNNDTFTNDKGQEQTVFNIIDQDAIKNIEEGDELMIVYPQNNTYNKTLKRGQETYQEGVLMLYDKKGNFVGVMKRIGAKTESLRNNKSIYYDLRKRAIDGAKKSTTFINETQGLKDTGLRIPVELVWHGHPNFKMNYEDGNLTVTDFDFTAENLDKIVDIGYVNNGEIFTKKGTDMTLNNQYYMTSTVKKNAGKKVPFVVFKLNGRNVMYPVSLKSLETNAIEDFNTILNDSTITNGEKVLRLNGLLNNYDIPYTSYFFNNNTLNDNDFIQSVRDRLTESELYGDVTAWTDNRSISDILSDEATINIDLNENPFHSPKIKFSIPVVDTQTETEGTAKKISTEQDFLNRKKAIETLMRQLPNEGVVRKGNKIETSPEYDTLKAQLDDLVDRYNTFLKNQEAKKRGSKKAQDDSDNEVSKDC